MIDKELYTNETIDKLEKIIVEQTLPKINGSRFIVVKYLLHDAFNSFDYKLTVSQKRRISKLLIERLKIYLKNEFDYEYVNVKKRFNKVKDIDTMIELYEINENERSTNGSSYFEKNYNFITRYDIVNGTSQVAKNYQKYL